MQRPNRSDPQDEQATVPGAVTRSASPSLPPRSAPILDEAGTLAFEVERTPTLSSEVEDALPEPTIDRTPVAVTGPPWKIWLAVAFLVAVGIGALLLL